MNAQAPWARVLLALVQQRRNQGAVWPLLVLLGLVCVPALAGIVLAPPPWPWLGASVLCMPLFGAWVWFLLSLVQQNHPSAARLVPGQLRALRLVLWGAWLVFTALAALLGSAFGHAWIAATGAALLMLLLTWIVRMPLLGFLFWLVPATSAHWGHTPVVAALLRSITAAGQSELDGIARAALLVLLAAVLTSPFALLRAGGTRHAAAYRRRTRQIAVIRTGGGDPTRWRGSGSVVGEWLGEGATGLYRRWLGRVSAQRSGALLPRALLGLGPAIHWTGQLGQALTFGAVAALVMFVLWQANASTQSVPVAAWGLSIGVLTFAVNVALQARAAIHGTRREQALMMLLPGMPQGRTLNIGLARRLSVQFMCSWLLGVLACVLLLPLGSTQGGWFATYAAACLPIAALLWTDWSRIQAPTAMSSIVPVLVVMPLTLCAIAAQAWLGVPAWLCVAGFAVAAVLLVARRAWRLSGAPSAFPAGRLSDGPRYSGNSVK